MSHFPPFKDVRCPTVHGLRARFCPVLRPRTVDERPANDWFNPKIHATRDKYAKIQPDTLQWCVVTATSQKTVPKAVMRNRLRRRWANAFADSLRSNGFHINGRSQYGSKDGTYSRPGLSGTLELLVYSPSGLTLQYHELLRSTGMVVKALRQGASRSKQGSQSASGAPFWAVGSKEKAGPASSAWSLVEKKT